MLSDLRKSARLCTQNEKDMYYYLLFIIYYFICSTNIYFVSTL